MFNRKQRRQLMKNISEEQFSTALAFSMLQKKLEFSLAEGTKVKFKQDKINRGNEKRNEWIDAHIDDVLTIEYDDKMKNHPMSYCLKEDDSEPKWLFNFMELEVVEEDKDTEKEEIKK